MGTMKVTLERKQSEPHLGSKTQPLNHGRYKLRRVDFNNQLAKAAADDICGPTTCCVYKLR